MNKQGSAVRGCQNKIQRLTSSAIKSLLKTLGFEDANPENSKCKKIIDLVEASFSRFFRNKKAFDNIPRTSEVRRDCLQLAKHAASILKILGKDNTNVLHALRNAGYNEGLVENHHIDINEHQSRYRNHQDLSAINPSGEDTKHALDRLLESTNALTNLPYIAIHFNVILLALIELQRSATKTALDLKSTGKLQRKPTSLPLNELIIKLSFLFDRHHRLGRISKKTMKKRKIDFIGTLAESMNIPLTEHWARIIPIVKNSKIKE